MRRRIERSRARCDRNATTNHKADKEPGAESQPKLTTATANVSAPKGG
jgi:hypothetical protein